MKKMNYQAPEMEVVEVKMKGNVLLVQSNNGDAPGFDETPGDGSDAA